MDCNPKIRTWFVAPFWAVLFSPTKWCWRLRNRWQSNDAMYDEYAGWGFFVIQTPATWNTSIGLIPHCSVENSAFTVIECMTILPQNHVGDVAAVSRRRCNGLIRRQKLIMDYVPHTPQEHILGKMSQLQHCRMGTYFRQVLTFALNIVLQNFLWKLVTILCKSGCFKLQSNIITENVEYLVL